MALEYAFVINPFIVISIAVLLYGIYLILFPSALYLLSRNNGPQAQRRVFVPALVALFIFATAALVLDIVGSAGGIILTFEDFNGEVTSATQAKSKVLFLNILEEMVLLMYTFANIAADTILVKIIYRLFRRTETHTCMEILAVSSLRSVGFPETCYRFARYYSYPEQCIGHTRCCHSLESRAHC
ncbi:hypothetical protein BT96DRAFT_363745 [Gymnopus androsaceus JB14]|uniref:Uncharacterized protein n=1 Tax=Gymnopus androsaceus JB14 TaxID=1447944 RepID=A0A6A4GY51_9AGAR|nr:hypothetical protein BT96DRAFT_363745 [Gymnopus androsaceus JB14]